MARYRFPVTQYEVLDGDSVRVYVDRGWGDIKRTICRLYQLDTPEIRNARSTLERKAAEHVKECVEHWMFQIGERGEEVETESVDKGAFWGRYWGDLYGTRDGVEVDTRLSAWLLDRGLAVQYSGGVRSWTDDQLTHILKSRI